MLRKTLILLLFFIGIDEAQTQEIEEKKVKYTEKWTKIPEIKKYKLEIRDKNDILIYEIETEKNEVEIEISPGEYKKRLGLLNSFGKIILWTDWKNFTIIEIIEPKLIYIEKRNFTRDSKEEKNLITIEGLTPKTKIYIQNVKSGKIKEIPYNQIDTNRVEIMLEPAKLPAGYYNLIIENSRNKKQKTENAIFNDFSIKEKKEQKLLSLRLKSVIPGLPQYEIQEKNKSLIILSSFLAAVLYTGYHYSKTLQTYKQYQQILKNYNITNAVGIVNPSSLYFYPLQYYRISLSQTINTYNYYKNQTYIGIALGLAVYSFHYYDFFKSYQKIKSQNHIAFVIQFSY